MCIQCRLQHREMNKYQVDKTQPACIETEGKRCERVLEWEDENDVIRNDPPTMVPSNFYALDLYQKIISTSHLQQIQYKKNKTHKITYIPTLEKLEMYLSIYARDLDEDEMDLLLRKIQIIYRYDCDKIIGS